MSYEYHHDTVYVDDIKFNIHLERDDYPETPWADYEPLGAVRDSHNTSTHYDGKAPGEVRIQSRRARYSYVYYYDFQVAVAKARVEGARPPEKEMEQLVALTHKKFNRPPTRSEIAEAAVWQEIRRFQDWLDNDWHYAYVTVKVCDSNEDEINTDELDLDGFDPDVPGIGGVESDDDDYIKEVAKEIIHDHWETFCKIRTLHALTCSST